MLNSFEAYYKKKHEFKDMDLSLNRIDDALSAAGFSENNLGKIVHIAGTNGKGSTAFFLEQISRKNGLKTALFTSPHILKINERISFCGINISDKDMDDIFNSHKNIVKKYSLTYFESVFFIAAIYFSLKKPDISIMETGMGGLYDATNTSLINNKTCVITSIAQDHVNFLGNSIYGILNEKLGIIRKKSEVIVAKNAGFVKKYIIDKGFPNEILFINEEDMKSMNKYPYPYGENYYTAKKTFETVFGKQIDDDYSLRLPMCRMEISGNIVFDGSHNPQGILSITQSMREMNINAVVFTVTAERDAVKTLTLLKRISPNIVMTTLPNNPRGINPENIRDCIFIKDPKDALSFAVNKFGGKVLITGSFYLCGYLKDIVQKGGVS